MRFLGIVSLALCGHLAACSSEPRRGPDFIVDATAQRYDFDNARGYRCVMVAFLSAESLLLETWTGQAQVKFRRDVTPDGQTAIVRDTSFITAVVAREDSGRFLVTFGPPLDLSFRRDGLTHWERFTEGQWDCASSLPLANDSTLTSRGYQALPEPRGDWFFGPARQID